MKTFLTVLSLFISTLLFAATPQTYYISASGDNTTGLTPAHAWKDITKLNSMMSIIASSDNILFNRGEVFYGAIIMTKNGSSLTPITFGAYGTGAKPVISGFSQATGWTNVGTNLWRSTALPGTNANITMVTNNGAVAQIGRWPNTGYRTFNSCDSFTYIVDNTLTGTTWTGADICIRKLADIISRDHITSHSGTTITYSGNLTGYRSIPAYGYFIQNSLAAVDIQNEWYFNPTTRQLTMYSSTLPTNVQVATKDTLLYLGGSDYITINGLSFIGGDKAAICFGGPLTGVVTNPKIINNDFDFSGRDAVYGSNNTGLLLDNNTINHSMNNGVILESEGGRSLNATVTNNTVRNTGTLAGMGYLNHPLRYDISYNAITNVSSPLPLVTQTYLVQYNTIDSVGHVGIAFYCNDAKIRNNKIDHHNYVTDDGGAINTFDITGGGTVEVGREITNNIVMNGIGAGIGAANGNNALGIYMDDKADGILVSGNTAVNNSTAGIYGHNITNVTIRDNISYNNGGAQILLVHDNHAIGMPIRGMVVTNNLLFANVSTQMIFVVRTRLDDVGLMFTSLDSNKWFRPTAPSGTTFKVTTFYQISNGSANYSRTSFKAAFSGNPYEVHSSETPTNTNSTRWEYNASKSAVTKTFSGRYIDVLGNIYNGSVTLQPYTAIVLTYYGALNVPPVANAGSNIVLTLPVNSTTLNGTGTDTDGTISSYSWVKLSGPSTGTINSASSATTALTNLVQGAYQFVLTVTDNNGAIAKDTVIVTVNPAINIIPVVNAGVNQLIVLPTNTVSLVGTATDADGSIGSTIWSLIYGPGAPVFGTGGSLSTSFSNLGLGVYSVKFTAIDNKGASVSDTVQIIVNAAPNVLPVANAGADKSITLPTTSVNVTGSGTDSDGTIMIYLWVKISGPGIPVIASPNTASTVIANLVVGTYKFELTVTDNSGDSKKDTMQLVVNPAANIPPVVNAGVDKSLILPTNSVMLTGSATDADGTISSVIWSKLSGPTLGTIVTPNSTTTTLTSLVQGVYKFELAATDNSGSIKRDTIQVTVAAASNISPVAIAGTDKVVTLPANSLTIIGSGSDVDGAIILYTWRKISGGTVTMSSTSTASFTATNMLQGVYQFELAVKDNSNAISKDTMQITVNAAPNQLPAVNAGLNLSFNLPISGALLLGAVTDVDGTIANIQWTKISGPGAPTIITPTSATTLILNMIQGTYKFRLTATDNRGGVAYDEVTITVGAALTSTYRALQWKKMIQSQ